MTPFSFDPDPHAPGAGRQANDALRAWRRTAPAALLLALVFAAPSAADDRAAIREVLRAGKVASVMLEVEADAVRAEARRRSHRQGQRGRDPEIRRYKRDAYAQLRATALAALSAPRILRAYRNLPLSLVVLERESELDALLASDAVRALHLDRRLHARLSESLPLIGQPAVVGAGTTGAGTTVAVLDSGVDFTDEAFGSCAAVGSPASCRVVDMAESAPPDACDSGGLDDDGHGSNVAGIVAAVAPGAALYVRDVFDRPLLSGVPGACNAQLANCQQSNPDWSCSQCMGAIDGCLWDFGASSSVVLDALDDVIDDAATYGIVAVNLSLGDGSHHTAECPGSWATAAFADARAAGVQPIVASGNEAYVSGGYVDGVDEPSCVPGAVSVGAVYEADWTGFQWTFAGGTPSECTQAHPEPDDIACTSQAGPTLRFLAPGVDITAGGPVGGTHSGTSMAAPHVSGAWALLREADPTLDEDELEQVLLGSGVSVLDPRNGRRTRRIDVAAAVTALTGDRDGDGWLDYRDNCIELANPTQCDADLDGVGNHCDADFDNDDSAGLGDFGAWREAFLDYEAGDPHDPRADLDCDGSVGLSDFGLFRQGFTTGVSGPSALACEGAQPGALDHPCQLRTDDADGDGVPDAVDLCPGQWNPEQSPDAC